MPGGFFPRAAGLRALLLPLAVPALLACSDTPDERTPDLSPENWADDYDRFLAAQLVDRTEAGVATGKRGAVAVAYNGLAARAGLEALKQGGGAIDAALTAALTQVALIEALRLATASGLVEDGHWNESPDALRKALDITRNYMLDFLPPETMTALLGSDFTPERRVTPEHAQALWAMMEEGLPFGAWAPATPGHSDDVVAIDADGNIAAITHSINAVLWGKTAIVVDGITIGDPASFQQQQIARIEPGARLPAPTETGILFRDGEPVLGFASMGSGLHDRTFQALLGVMHYGQTVDEAINTPDFFLPDADPAAFQLTFRVPAGGFPREVLDGTGYAYEELDAAQARLAGEGLWVAVSRDPATGELRAASHNRNNSAAVAW